MIQRKALLIILILTIPLFFITSQIETSKGENRDFYMGGNNLESVSVGTLAPDFSIMDVDSRENHTLYDYHGKMILLDLWATWCGPCEISLPFIRLFYDMYPEEMLTIISIDIDESETDSQVSSFRKSHNMDWIVGIDYDNSIQDDYGSGFVPTFYLLNTTGHVVWYQVGIDVDNFYSDLYGHISQYYPDDVTAPIIIDYEVKNKSSELSIFYPTFRIFANISEDRKLQFVEAAISTSVETKYVLLKFEKINDFYIINQSYTLEPEDLYGENEVTIEVTFTDFWNLNTKTSLLGIPVTAYVDTGPPTLSDVGIIVSVQDQTRYEVKVYAAINEDLMLTKADVRLLKGEDIVKVWNFEEYNGTHMLASGIVLVSLAEAHELTARIILKDVAGNIVEEDFTVAEDPENPGNTENLNFNYFFAILGIILILGCTYRRKR